MAKRTELISVAEAARIIGVSTVRVRTYINEGRLKAQRVGRAFVVDRAAAVAFKPKEHGRPAKAGD